MTAQQPEAIKLASEYRETMPADVLHLWAGEVVGELRRLHAENATLRSGYDASRLEIESLRARVQELGEMLRENRSKRIVALEAENLGLLHALAAEQDANTDLCQQLEAIGAGGVEPLRKTNSLEICGIKTHHGQLLRAALQEAEAALEVALARILKRDPGHSVNVTSEAKALVIVRNALDESNHPDHFPGATEMVPQGWKLVPVEPTEGMLGAGLRHIDGLAAMPSAYRAMLAAAPQPPVARRPDGDTLRKIARETRTSASDPAMPEEYVQAGWLAAIAAYPLPPVDHLRDATEMVPAGWAISYDGKTPHALWTAGEGDLLDLEVKRQGGTARKMALYARVEK